MKKYFIEERLCVKKARKKYAFDAYYTIKPLYDNEVFDTLEEARIFCKKNNITTYDISDDKKTICWYWIEEREVDEDNEIISDEYEHYAVNTDEENKTLIFNRNTDLYELVDDFYSYREKFAVAEKLFYKSLKDGNLNMDYYDLMLDSDTLYNGNEEVVTSNDPDEIIRHLKNLNVYDVFIDKYISYSLDEVIFKM